MKRGLLIPLTAGLLLAGVAGGGLLPAGSGGTARAQGAAEPKDDDPQQTIKDLQDALQKNAEAVKALREENARERERQRQQAELQQKQIEVLEKTARVLADQIKRQGTAAAAEEDVATKTATLEARARQAAQRDVELAAKADELTERLDSVQRFGTPLPFTAREMFLPSEPNETPLSIYGQLLGSYRRQNRQAGLFQSPAFGPWVLIQLNRRFMLEANFDITSSGVSLGQGQLGWYITNWLTLVAGRFLTPIGFFNERLSAEWINKLPDIPIMFRQVMPLTSTDGLQLRGSHYLGPLPYKLEYSLYAGNGFQYPSQATGLMQVADLQGLTGSPDAVNARAFGGRLGMWIPEYGLNFGFSGYQNGVYSPGNRAKYQLWDFDVSYHWRNWDFRTEFASTTQGALAIIGNNVSRTGLYSQIAYRNYNAKNRFLANFEGVFRYGFANFHGLDARQLDPTAFPTTYDVPVSRTQWTWGINYYFYPSMVLKFAYEVNAEKTVDYHDNIYYVQGVWAF